MCGRTACTLAPDDLQRACTYRDRKGCKQKPAWRDAPSGKQYFPSYNIAPGAHTPVLMSSQHVPELEAECERVLQPMLWGLVPSWHRGSLAEKAYETNNCRAESMLEKNTYKVPLQKGRRCVILAEGFFEWKRDKSNKQPYYIYFPTSTDGKHDLTKVKVEGQTEIKQETDCTETTEIGIGKTEENTCAEVKAEGKDGSNHKVSPASGEGLPKLLTMAGVFDVWEPKDSEPVYSYSVITVESSPAMAWIHHRMPALLTSDEEIDQWLSFGEIPLTKAVKLIRPTTCLQSHPVSTMVNNSRNKSPDCIKKIDPSKPSASSNMMMSWLSKAVKKDRDSQEPPNKKAKTS